MILVKTEGRKVPNEFVRCNQTEVWIKHGFSTLGINFDNNNTIQAEFEYKANLAMFAGYPSSPSSIVYWSCNSQTKSTLVSHNVI
jgi:hypothetical protein